jgi:hypothetical protein
MRLCRNRLIRISGNSLLELLYVFPVHHGVFTLTDPVYFPLQRALTPAAHPNTSRVDDYRRSQDSRYAFAIRAWNAVFSVRVCHVPNGEIPARTTCC